MHATQIENERTEWIDRVKTLTSQVRAWAEAADWSVHEDVKTITERQLGTYQLPVLRVRTSNGEVHINPIALHIAGKGAVGRIDLESFPSLNRVRLIGDETGWVIMTDSNVPLRKPWDKDTFVELVGDLVTTL